MKNDLKKQRDKLSRFEKTTDDLWKSFEKYLDLQREMLMAESTFHDDLRRFFTDEDGEVINGSASHLGVQFVDAAREDRGKKMTLVETMKITVGRVHSEYQQIFNAFKKRLGEANASDREKTRISDDLEIFEEQRQDKFDSLLILLLKMNEYQSNTGTDWVMKWNQSGMQGGPSSNGEVSLNSTGKLRFDYVLHNQHGLNYFRAFLDKEFSSENIEFWLAVNVYRAIPDEEQRKRRALEMYKKYIRSGAEHELNITKNFSEVIHEQLSLGQPTLFDDAQKSIFLLMEADSYSRFEKDPLYHRLLNRLKKRDFVNFRANLIDEQSVDASSAAAAKAKQRKESILTDRDWNLLLNGADLVTYVKGDVVLRKNDPKSQYFYKIHSGRVKIEDGEGNYVNLLDEGEVFGETYFLDLTNSYNYVAVDFKVQIYRIEERVLSTLLQVDCSFSERFFQMLCTQLSIHIHSVPLRTAISAIHDKRKNATEDKGAKLRDSNNNSNVANSNEEAETRLRILFNLNPDDTLVQEIACSFVKTKIKMHGVLYVFTKHLCFYSKIFGMVTKISEAYHNIVNMDSKNKKLIIQTPKQKFIFAMPGPAADIYQIIFNVGKPSNNNNNNNNNRAAAQDPMLTTQKERSYTIEGSEAFYSDKAWDQIFEFATCKTYKKDEIVLKEGESSRRMYQIANGSCRAQLGTGENAKLLSKMKTGQIFGEITYMFGGGATVSILANEDGVKVYYIDRVALQDLFNKKPELAARFNRYLAHQIGKRVLPKGPIGTSLHGMSSNHHPGTVPTKSASQSGGSGGANNNSSASTPDKRKGVIRQNSRFFLPGSKKKAERESDKAPESKQPLHRSRSHHTGASPNSNHNEDEHISASFSQFFSAPSSPSPESNKQETVEENTSLPTVENEIPAANKPLTTSSSGGSVSSSNRNSLPYSPRTIIKGSSFGTSSPNLLRRPPSLTVSSAHPEPSDGEPDWMRNAKERRKERENRMEHPPL